MAGTLLPRAPRAGEGGHGSVREPLPVGRRRSPTAPPELDRLVSNPADVLAEDLGLGLRGEIVKYAEVASLLGGETAIQGAAPNPESDGVLIRNVDNDVFDERIAEPRVGPIDSFKGPRSRTSSRGWRAVRSTPGYCTSPRCAGRRPTTADPVSSAPSSTSLKAKGLLTDMTVIIHGTALERPDFAEMRAAPTIRTDGVGDGRGAKLVWSPLSNMLLYGETANVYEALAEGVLSLARNRLGAERFARSCRN